MLANGSTNWKSTGQSVVRIESFSHLFFAVTMIGLGIFGLIKGEFTPTWSGVPKGLAAREVLPYLCAFISLACGILLLFQRTALIASRLLLISFLVWFFLFRLSHIFFAPKAIVTWWACGDTAVMLAATLVLHVWFTHDQNTQRFSFLIGHKGLRIARVLYGLAMLPFGVAHFIYLKETIALVPGWLPWHIGWAYFTGCAFIAAGVAVLIGVCARFAATLSTLQLALFTLLVWVPIILTGGANAFQWTEFIDSWALTAGAWVVADSYRGMHNPEAEN